MKPNPAPLPVLLALTFMLSAPGCDNDRPDTPARPGASAFESFRYRPGSPPFPAPPPSSEWRLGAFDSGDSLVTVRLLTHWTAGEFHWRWEPDPDVTDTMDRFLAPLTAGLFHAQRIPSGRRPGPPLPIQSVESAEYPHLLSLLQELTDPWFGQVVRHWPDRPVPVRCGEAVAGLVDLSACLAEAVDVWNASETEPWFQADEEADWGVRLVHFPDRRLSPPLSIRITRLDSTRSPLRMNLLAGNNYDALREPRYVVRGFVHELGHALFLWGHTRDRIHCLWGAAPPIVDEPSADERKAARLWHGLPVGLDLSLYE